MLYPTTQLSIKNTFINGYTGCIQRTRNFLIFTMSKTITDIIPPSRRRALEEESGAPASFEPEMPTRFSQPPTPLKDGPIPTAKKSFPYGTAIFALLLITGSIALLASFANAKVTITPYASSATINDQFTATFGVGDFQYQIITVTKTVSATVTSETNETVNDPAQGTIVVSNTQSNPQTLIKNTRFESADDHIFRIHDGIIVPPGTTATPGTVSAIAYADMGGDGYNIAPTTFTLPGLKGSKMFTLVTAKSTTAMTGGFSGTRASVSQATRDTQNAASKIVLDKQLLDEATKKLPDGYVVISGGTFTKYLPQTDTAGTKSGQVNVNLQGTLTAVAFSNGSLAKVIASKIIGTYSFEPVHLLEPSKLSLIPQDTTVTPDGSAPFTFTLKGDTEVVYDIDTKKITAAIAGKTKDSAKTILASLHEVNSAVLQVRPFWKQAFPEDPTNITVVVTSPQTR